MSPITPSPPRRFLVAALLLVCVPLLAQTVVSGLLERAEAQVRIDPQASALMAYGLQRLDQLLDQLPARGHRCALLIVDLDHFKRINDSDGHPAGDGVLRAAAAVLQEAGRAPIAMGRLGGDEFVIVLRRADRALYLAKARGRNRVEAVSPADELSAPAATGPDRNPPSAPIPSPPPAA